MKSQSKTARHRKPTSKKTGKPSQPRRSSKKAVKPASNNTSITPQVFSKLEPRGTATILIRDWDGDGKARPHRFANGDEYVYLGPQYYYRFLTT